jgi:hypothetical protein
MPEPHASPPPPPGNLAFLAAHSGNDTLAAVAATLDSGTLTAAENHDTFVGLAYITGGSLAAVEGPDVASIAATCIVANLAGGGRDDRLAAAGLFTAAGSIAPTGGNDTLASAGRFTAAGSIAASGGADSFGGVAVNTFVAVGVLHGGGGDTFAGIGTRSTSASLAGAERRDTAVGVGRLLTAATLAPVERADVFAGFSGDVVAGLAGAGRPDTFAGFQTGLEYQIYSNTGIGDPIDYSLAIATTGLLTWTSSPLAHPGTWRFGVRAYSTATGLEEENLDASVTIVLDASGVDITNQPKAPTSLRAIARAGGTIRVEWAYNTINPFPIPTGFKVYSGTGGTPDYTTPVATVAFGGAVAGSFQTDVTGLADGTAYTFGVRAYNATAQEANTSTVTCTADATGPAAVVSLTATAVV